MFFLFICLGPYCVLTRDTKSKCEFSLVFGSPVVTQSCPEIMWACCNGRDTPIRNYLADGTPLAATASTKVRSWFKKSQAQSCHPLVLQKRWDVHAGSWAFWRERYFTSIVKTWAHPFVVLHLLKKCGSGHQHQSTSIVTQEMLHEHRWNTSVSNYAFS
jgi:hypothetical protein